VYVYESTNLATLITYSPYSNKFENPLPTWAKGSFCICVFEINIADIPGNILLFIVNFGILFNKHVNGG